MAATSIKIPFDFTGPVVYPNKDPRVQFYNRSLGQFT